MINLDYLKNITIWKDGMACPLIYGHKNREGIYIPKSAEHEGVGCCDDAARAAILMMDDANPENEYFIQGYLNFLEYMIVNDGVINFITDADFNKNEDGPTSYAGGQWWAVRARYAFARACRYYRIAVYNPSKTDATLKRYRNHCLILDELFGEFESEKIKALYILSQLELDRANIYSRPRLRYPILKTEDNVFVNEDGKPWGYHQLWAAVSFNEHVADIYTDQIRSTIDTYIKDLIYDVEDDVCAYSFSSIIQGLTGHPVLQKQMIEKFYSIFVVGPDGSCSDGINNYDTGAESCCEAGFIRLCEKRLKDQEEYYLREGYSV